MSTSHYEHLESNSGRIEYNSKTSSATTKRDSCTTTPPSYHEPFKLMSDGKTHSGCPFFPLHSNSSSNTNSDSTTATDHTAILDSIPSIQFLPDGVLIVNESNLIIECNTTCQRLFGYSRAELLGQPVSILVPPEYRGHHDALTRVVYDSMQPRQMGERKTVSAYHRSGTRFEVSIHLAPSYLRPPVMQSSTISNGFLVETSELQKIVTCVCRDMTSHNGAVRARNEAEQRSAHMESFLRLINHEIKTSIHGIANALDTVKREMVLHLKATGFDVDQIELLDKDEDDMEKRTGSLEAANSHPDRRSDDRSGNSTRSPSTSSAQPIVLKNSVSSSADRDDRSSPKSALRSLGILEQGVASMDVLFRNMLDFRNLQDGSSVQNHIALDISNFFETVKFNQRARWKAKRQNVIVVVDRSIPLVLVDSELLAKLIDSLFDNSIKHAGTGTNIMLQCTQVQANSRGDFIDYLPSTRSSSSSSGLGSPMGATDQDKYNDATSAVASPRDLTTPPEFSDTSRDFSHHSMTHHITRAEYLNVVLSRSQSDPNNVTQVKSAATDPSLSGSNSTTVGNLSPSLPPQVTPQATPLRLPSYISHLLDRRIKSDPGPSVHSPPATTNLLFIVCDDGTGIPSLVLNSLEDGFLHVDTSSTRHTTGGLGLGLRIAKLCARKLNGTLSLDSILNEVTTNDTRNKNGKINVDAIKWRTVFSFVVTLPIVPAPTSSNTSDMAELFKISEQVDNFRSLSEPSSRSAIVERLCSSQFKLERARFRILIVEDNVINVKVLKQSLIRNGFRAIQVCTDGQQAVDLIQSMTNIAAVNQNIDSHDQPDDNIDIWLPFDLILMDCEMPVRDGCSASVEIRRLKCLSPIFALTANATLQAQLKCAESGMDLFLNKPLQSRDLFFAMAALKPFQFYELDCCPHVLIPTMTSNVRSSAWLDNNAFSAHQTPIPTVRSIRAH